MRNLIDEHLFGAMAKDKVPHAPLSGDEEFCRRVYLDLTGRIPTPEQLLAFVDNSAPDKRDKLIDELIDSPAWVDHWGYWYGDLFRNCANRIGKPATKHFDQWFRQLPEGRPALRPRRDGDADGVGARTASGCPTPAPAAYLARWHVPGDTMYSDRYEDTADEIVVQSARIFLGINYQCISCHGGKGFLEKVNLDLVSKKRSDLWAMAAFFGKTRVRIVPFQDRFTITEDGTGYDTKAPQLRAHAAQGRGRSSRRSSSPARPPTRRKPLRPQFARMLTTPPAVRPGDGEPDLEAVLRPGHRRSGRFVRHGPAGPGQPAAGAVDGAADEPGAARGAGQRFRRAPASA